MAVDDLGLEELDERMRREMQGVRQGIRTLLITGMILVTIYALAGFLIFF